MDKAAIDRDDRQTFLALVMASGLPAIGQLKKLQQARGAKPAIDTSRTDSVPEAFTYLKPSREPCLIPFFEKADAHGACRIGQVLYQHAALL